MLYSVDKNESDSTLEVRHYGSKENTFLVYNDDGISYDYERGECALTELKVTKNKKGQLKGSSKALKNNKYNYENIVWRWITKLH